MDNERSVKTLLWTVSVIWGLNVVMIKFLIGHFPPITLAAVRIGAATLLLTAILLWNREMISGARQIPRRSWIYIVGAGITGIFLHQMTLGIGLQTANASTSSLILGLNPLVTGILAYLLFREPLTWSRLAGVVFGFVGVFTVVMADSLAESSVSIRFGKGEWFVILAMLAYVVSGLFIKKAAEKVPVTVVTGYMHIVGSVLLIAASLFETQSHGAPNWPSDWFVWAVLLFSGWVATALCGIWWNNGIRKIGAGRTAMFLNGMPVSSLVFAVVLLDERLNWIHLAGFGLVILGIWLGTMNKKIVTICVQPPVPPKEGCA
jgi:drug/metabolite transporter (DMT)-like permease